MIRRLLPVIAGVLIGFALAVVPSANAAWNPANSQPEEAYSHPYDLDTVVSGDSITCNMIRIGHWSTMAYGRAVRWVANCRIGRYASEAVDALYRQQSYGSYGPRDVVLATGTNDCRAGTPVTPTAFRTEVDRGIRQAGRNRRVLLVDIYRSDAAGAACPAYNAQLTAAASSWRNSGYNVRVGYWSELAAANKGWFTDGVHPSVAGLDALADLILDWKTGQPNPYVR